jgi:hypothetical protein
VVRGGILAARVALPALLAFAVMTGAEHLAGTSPIRSPVRPTSVFWAGRIFATRTELAKWLHAHGSSYETWASAHPALAAGQPTAKRPVALQAHRASHSRGQDPTHLFAVAVAVCVALVLVLVLLYQRRLYDFRGSLQRVGSVPARSRLPSRPKLVALPAGGLAPRGAAVAFRARVVNPTLGAAKAVASSAGPAFLAVAGSRERQREWLHRFRGEHPDVTWFIGACAFAVAVGVAIPFIVR